MKRWLLLSSLFFLFFFQANAAESISNSSIHWGFKKGSNGKQAEAGEAYDNLLKKYDAFYKGNVKDKVLYLTFDNGYENGYTEKVLDVLKAEKVPAAFFVTGHYLDSAPDLAKRIVEEGHIIGNHSWSHPDMTKISDEKIQEELERVKEKTAGLTGQTEMQYLRPPRGILSERTLKATREQGYIHVLWSLAYKDWQTDQQKGWKHAYNNIMAQIHPGAVILLHSVSKDNADALEKVINDLKKEGYTFKSLDDYMLREKIKNPIMSRQGLGQAECLSFTG